MSAGDKDADQANFEKLLDSCKEKLEQRLSEGEKFAPLEFEKAVVEQMQECAKGTEFEGKIEGTSKRAFPDLVAGRFGVEIKQTDKDKFLTIGNSIFEGSRDKRVEELYIFICATGGPKAIVEWKSYEDAIDNISVTHSPRYRINFYADKNLFSQMKVTYKQFSDLPNDKKMEKVRELLLSREDDLSDLWWLNIQQDTKIDFRWYFDLDGKEQEALKARLFLLFPGMFGKGKDKYKDSIWYLLMEGIVVHNLRDAFTAGGKWETDSGKHPRIYEEAVKMLAPIMNFARETSVTILNARWPLSEYGVAPLPDNASTVRKMSTWLQLVIAISENNKEACPKVFIKEAVIAIRNNNEEECTEMLIRQFDLDLEQLI